MPLDIWPDSKGVSWLAKGASLPAQAMQLRNRSGSAVDVTGGTWSLYKWDATTTAIATGTIQASSKGELITSVISVPSDAKVGQYREVWEPTATGTTLIPITRLAIVATHTVQPFVTHNTVVTRLPKLASAYPSTQNGWDPQIEQAWQEISDWCWRQSTPHTYWTADGLRMPLLYRSLAVVLEACATGVGDTYTEQADRYRLMSEDALTKAVMAFRDTDGDGSVDAKPAGGMSSAFTPAGKPF